MSVSHLARRASRAAEAARAARVITKVHEKQAAHLFGSSDVNADLAKLLSKFLAYSELDVAFLQQEIIPHTQVRALAGVVALEPLSAQPLVGLRVRLAASDEQRLLRLRITQTGYDVRDILLYAIGRINEEAKREVIRVASPIAEPRVRQCDAREAMRTLRINLALLWAADLSISTGTFVGEELRRKLVDAEGHTFSSNAVANSTLSEIREELVMSDGSTPRKPGERGGGRLKRFRLTEAGLARLSHLRASLAPPASQP